MRERIWHESRCQSCGSYYRMLDGQVVTKVEQSVSCPWGEHSFQRIDMPDYPQDMSSWGPGEYWEYSEGGPAFDPQLFPGSGQVYPGQLLASTGETPQCTCDWHTVYTKGCQCGGK